MEEEEKGTRRHYYITLLKDDIQGDNMEDRQTKVKAEGRSRWVNCSVEQQRKNIQSKNQTNKKPTTNKMNFRKLSDIDDVRLQIYVLTYASRRSRETEFPSFQVICHTFSSPTKVCKLIKDCLQDQIKLSGSFESLFCSVRATGVSNETRICQVHYKQWKYSFIQHVI